VQAFFRLNNSILDCGLTPNELKVAVCLYSCVFNNRCVVQIKQATIAQKCGIKKIETVANIICQLQRKGIIERVFRPHKANGQLGTYIYKLKTIVSKGYFKIKRYILGKLNGVQLRMYLFVCRAITKKNDMWNSFNDISRALRIGRKKVIAVINELVGMGFIRKLKVLKKDGSYSDNHYSVSEPTVENKNQGKKEESPKQATTLFGTFRNILHIDYILPVIACQAVKQDFFYFQSGVVP
jgi:DNA-binding MarR family transcriptional regulator